MQLSSKLNQNKQDKKQFRDRQYHHLLPSPAILESYEELYPGFTKTLLELVKKEQNDRFITNKEMIKSAYLSKTSNQFTALFFTFCLLFGCIMITFFSKSTLVPMLIIISWFSLIYLINITER